MATPLIYMHTFLNISMGLCIYVTSCLWFFLMALSDCTVCLKYNMPHIKVTYVKQVTNNVLSER